MSPQTNNPFIDHLSENGVLRASASRAVHYGWSLRFTDGFLEEEEEENEEGEGEEKMN